MSKRPSYTDDFRANAVVMLQAEGYPDKKGALTRIATQLKVPARTLSRWFNHENNPPPDIIVKKKRGDLVERINDELDSILDAFTGVRPDASYRDLATSFGIMVDKLQLLTGKPTGRVDNTGKMQLSITGLEDLSDDELDRLLTPD